MRYFCTYFDHNYAARGLALYASLKKHSPSFKLFVLCLSDECHAVMTRLNLPDVELIALNMLEKEDSDLLRTKSTRTLVEYYFTCTPVLPLFIFECYAEVDILAYLDGDTFFFSDPEIVFEEIGDNSVSITPHRFDPSMRAKREIFGKFNVGWISFRRDKEGLSCLRWYREKCIEWCYDRVDGARYADQKYLDSFSTLFGGVRGTGA